ncbi:hypothetical protein [Aedoeadaptatus coxii]|uniref:hypothetical protein n=1 Tax=Aedoeadaptatus coxii TaxID=755172 RepID=UPI002AD49969|nr:hypothetical protein [Peptoniphilus coxii]
MQNHITTLLLVIQNILISEIWKPQEEMIVCDGKRYYSLHAFESLFDEFTTDCIYL